jgi:hypothetical protein
LEFFGWTVSCCSTGCCSLSCNCPDEPSAFGGSGAGGGLCARAVPSVNAPRTAGLIILRRILCIASTLAYTDDSLAMLTNDEMCMSRRSFQIWSASQFMPWGAIRGCFSGARKFCVPSKALTKLCGQLAVSYLGWLWNVSRCRESHYARGRHWRIKYPVAV